MSVPAPSALTETTAENSATVQYLQYPLISITYCVRCKWMLRAAWYQQELLQTFGSKAIDEEGTRTTIGCVILAPSLVSGTFKVAIKKSESDDWHQIWDRTLDNGFPDSKILKQRVRDYLFPELKLSHLDKPNRNGGLLAGQTEIHSVKTHETEGTEPRSGKSLTEECLECTRTWEG